jgi:hypothetical protein
MALRCRPGDIAVVLSGDGCGAFVDVLQRSPDHPLSGEAAWECRIKAPMLVTIVDMKRRRIVDKLVIQPGETAMFVDSSLQPIRPPAPPTAIPAPPIELECT